jgi:hypothetical protein
MKRILIAAVTITVAVTTPYGIAAAQRRFVPFAGGGLATGTGDLSQGTDNGWLAFAGVDVPLGLTPGLTVGLTGSYSHLPYRGAFSEAMNIPAVFGELGYVIAAKSSSIVKPYVRGGAGVQIRKYDPGSTGYRKQSDGGIAFSAGGGLQFLVSSTALFVGAHFVSDADAGVLGFHGGLAWPGRAAK